MRKMIAGRSEQLTGCGGSSALYDFVPTDEELQAKREETNNNGKEEHVYATPCANNYDLPLMSNNYLRRSDDSSSLAVDENRPYCRALYDFSSEYDNELSFSVGEIIYLTRCVNYEWMEGEMGRNGQRGIFPTNFVEIVVDFLRPQENNKKVVNDLLPSPLEPPLNNYGANNVTFGSATGVVGMALAVDDFAARFSDELSLRGGDSVRVLELVDDSWARCQNLADNRIGFVPQSYLQIFLDTDDSYNFAATSTPVNELKSFAASIVSGGDIAMSSLCKFSVTPLTFTDGFDTFSSPTIGAKLHPALPPPLPVDMDVLGQSFSGSGSDSFCGGGTLRTSPMRAAKKQQGQQQQQQQQKQAPVRPPPPKKLSASPFGSNFGKPLPFENAAGDKSATSTSGLLVPSATLTTTSSSTDDTEDQKKRVVQDLLNTEITYLFDLDTWQTCIARSTTLKEETKCVLNNGLPLLKQLSQALIDNIRVEKGKPISDQCYGQMFMGMREMFFRTFSNHCRCVEQIGQILENNGEDTGNNNSNTQEALNQCIMEMRQMGSNIFDVPTAVSRPIQRCLKYPLYVGELLKNTPINHIDHPKLMEAVKQLGSLASKMNECKRRKELIRKYREDQQLSLAERLARINVHSFVKKSNRLKYRISSTMGFNTVRDSEFDNLIMWLDGAERRVCKFLYCAQLYKKNIEVAFKRHEDSYRGLCPVQEESALQAFSSTFRALDQIQKEFFQQLENEIINEGKTLTRCEYTKLIHKRCDKLADYETAKAANKSSSEMERRRNEYEALNNQVKSGLPKTISFINKKVIHLVHLMHQIDDRLMKQMDQWYREERPPNVRTLAVDMPDFRRFVVQTCRNRFHEMDKILRFDSQNQQQQQSQNQNVKINNKDRTANSVKSSNNGSRSVARRSASLRLVNTSTANGSKRSLKKPFATSASSTPVANRCQTSKQRDALIKIMRAQNAIGDLRRVSAPFLSTRLELNVDDVVIVKRHKAGACLCDNGVATDYVPMECLRKFDDVDESFNGGIVGGDGSVPTRVAPAIPTRITLQPLPPTTASRSTFYDLLIDNAVSDQCLSSQHFRPVSLPTLDSFTKATTTMTKQPSIFDSFDELFESSKPQLLQTPTTASINNNFGFGGAQLELLTAGIVPPPPMMQHRRHPSPLTSTLSQSNNSGSPFAAPTLTTVSGIMKTNSDALKPTIKRTTKPQNDLIDLDEDLIDLGSPTPSKASVNAQPHLPTIFPVNDDTSGLLSSSSGILL